MGQTLPLLYKLTSTGKTQTWTVEVEDDKYRTHSGILNGKIVVSAWTTCKGKNLGKKNETTPAAQAEKEANAKWVIKQAENYGLSPNASSNATFKEPLLAENWDNFKPGYPCFTQPKLDGIRCIARADGLYSRKWKQFKSAPHILEVLAPVFKKYPHIELDGELYNHAYRDNFDDLASMIRPLKPTKDELAEARNEVQYWVYDIRDPDKTFSERLQILEEIIDLLNIDEVQEMVIITETREAHTEEDVDKQYEEALEDGFEGLMIRSDTPYIFGRTQNLLKRKEFITEEFEIVDILEGKGNRAGMAGKVVIKFKEPTTEGIETCEANPKGGFAFYRRLLANKQLVIGKMATIEFQNYTPKKSLRFPKVVAIRDYE